MALLTGIQSALHTLSGKLLFETEGVSLAGQQAVVHTSAPLSTAAVLFRHLKWLFFTCSALPWLLVIFLPNSLTRISKWTRLTVAGP